MPYKPGWLRTGVPVHTPLPLKRERFPLAEVRVRPTKEKPVATSTCMNEKVRDDVLVAANNIAVALRNTVQLPDWSLAVAAEHFVEDEEDRRAIVRTCTVCQSHISEDQRVTHSVNAARHETDPNYRVNLTYHYRSKKPVFLFPHDADIHPLMQTTEEYRLLTEYVDNWYEADKRASHFKALALYLAFACPSLNQLKMVWPEFGTVFAKPDYANQYQGARDWVARFDKTEVGKVPDLFPGFQAEIAEAQRTVGMYLMLDKAEDYVTNWTAARACPIDGPRVPWWDHVPNELKENTTAPGKFRWCL